MRRTFLLLAVVFFLLGLPIFTQLYENKYNYGAERYFSSKEYFDKELLKLSEQKISQTNGLDLFSVEEKATLLKAEIEFYDGRGEFAIKILQDFINDNPLSMYVAFFYEKIAQYYFEFKDYEHAISYFKKAIEVADNEYKRRKDSEYRALSARSLFWSGIAQLLAGKVDLARGPLEQCFRNYSDSKSADDALFYLA